MNSEKDMRSVFYRAVVTFLDAQHGGWRSVAPTSGYRPALKIDDVFASCSIDGESEGKELALNVAHNVYLRIGGQRHCRLLRPEEVVEFYEGERLVGKGRVLSVEYSD